MACHMWSHYLSQCWFTDSRHSEISIKIHMYKHFFLQKCIWKWHPQNCNYFFVQASMCREKYKTYVLFQLNLAIYMYLQLRGKWPFSEAKDLSEWRNFSLSDSGSFITSDALLFGLFYCGDFLVQRVTRTFQLSYITCVLTPWILIAHLGQWHESSLLQVMVCRLFVTNPLQIPSNL